MTFDYATAEGASKNMKTKKELHALKEEYECLQCKLRELTEEELNAVAGGVNEWDEMLIKGANQKSCVAGGGVCTASNGSGTTDR